MVAHPQRMVAVWPCYLACKPSILDVAFQPQKQDEQTNLRALRTRESSSLSLIGVYRRCRLCGLRYPATWPDCAITPPGLDAQYMAKGLPTLPCPVHPGEQLARV